MVRGKWGGERGKERARRKGETGERGREDRGS